ncbi:IclR family transcriptional regulator C-terminal domain-containing protein [Verrucosispora sp. WMMD573]|uniref:IclR family transcriptional regulator C-terminal domain-containing protein n=1 Tax=Verrucosispora sp. WMMD573 TaxID=3015149 RepID=UPI00248BF376|nr:IclR family transcriptional regulator C-terminal domain-containing protein [Verrucosispora sp. WMMD573]WBB52947.1 IclR family transcriptional regulator C-terminal domain-containing protein [Verrucosispora sp. WMMD573]
MLLAYAPAEVQEKVLATPLERYTPLTVTDPGRLRRGLAEVRRTGYAVSDRQVTMDALSVAAPICGPEGSVVAAISLVVAQHRADPVALAPLVQAAGRTISRSFGTSYGSRRSAG